MVRNTSRQHKYIVVTARIIFKKNLNNNSSFFFDTQSAAAAAAAAVACCRDKERPTVDCTLAYAWVARSLFLSAVELAALEACLDGSNGGLGGLGGSPRASSSEALQPSTIR